MIYDITVEPWIPVRMLDGSRKKVGLLDLFKDAHNIKQLDGLNVMEEYSVYRFLTLFLMAVYLPGSIDDVFGIFNIGRIDMSKVDEYLSVCRSEGVSFDIFDVKRPFLQSPYDARYDKDSDIKSIANLDCTMPSGNNHIHFNHVLEDDAVMPVDKAVRCLLAVQIFCTAASQGYPSNVNGAPPYFFIPKGRNLFETLVFSLQPVSKKLISEKLDMELWRNSHVVVPKKTIVKVSVFYGMLFPSRRIRLIDEGSSLLRKCYFQPGLNFVGYDSWSDFYVAYYYVDKKGRFSLKPSVSKELWRNLGTIYSMVYSQVANFKVLSVVNQYKYIMEQLDRSDMPMLSFGVATNNASYLDQQRGELILNVNIANSIEKVNAVNEAIGNTEHVAVFLKKALDFLIKDLGGRKDFHMNDILQSVHEYYGKCELQFYDFCDSLATMSTEQERVACLEKWNVFIRDSAIKIYDLFTVVICNRSKELKAAMVSKKYLFSKLYPKDKGKEKKK